ncbi:MAG: helix-turn-helix domain-containing protein [Lachnospiraceae bacterium]|nr:helix-turn-helix domain-containing protein [Lachnospiraceae bacterium]
MSKGLILYATIVAAKNGNSEAIKTIMNYFTPYILRAAKRTVLNEYGDSVEYVDWDAVQRIEQKLMVEIIYTFDCERLPEGETLEN